MRWPYYNSYQTVPDYQRPQEDTQLRDNLGWTDGCKPLRNMLMYAEDKVLLRKRAVIETVNYELKNIAQIGHPRFHSFNNTIANIISISQSSSPSLLTSTENGSRSSSAGIGPCPSCTGHAWSSRWLTRRTRTGWSSARPSRSGSREGIGKARSGSRPTSAARAGSTSWQPGRVTGLVSTLTSDGSLPTRRGWPSSRKCSLTTRTAWTPSTRQGTGSRRNSTSRSFHNG